MRPTARLCFSSSRGAEHPALFAASFPRALVLVQFQGLFIFLPPYTHHASTSRSSYSTPSLGPSYVVANHVSFSPFSQAPSEAEAQCAELARGGKVYAAGSEDMDTLTFGSPILYRHLTFSEAKKQPISEIDLAKALDGLDMSMDQVHLHRFRL